MASKNRNFDSNKHRSEENDSNPLGENQASELFELDLDFESGFESTVSLGLDEEYAGLAEPEAIVFKRNLIQTQSRTRLRCFTSLERLGLDNFSSDESRSLSVHLGLFKGLHDDEDADVAELDGRADIEGENDLNATGVKILLQIRSESRDLRVEGKVNTVLTTDCVRCKAKSINKVTAHLNFLLSSTPVVEPSEKNLGIILGESDRWQAEDPNYESEPLLDIDLDDKIYFPIEEKEIDLSKYIRDSVHLEVPLGSVCNDACRGLCVNCGVNLNVMKCDCKGVVGSSAFDVLQALKTQLEEAKEAEGKD